MTFIDDNGRVVLHPAIIILEDLDRGFVKYIYIYSSGNYYITSGTEDSAFSYNLLVIDRRIK